jgi:hypothetical protein
MMHVFDDIEAKGASRGFGTHVNEKMHGPLRGSYRYNSNGKDVAKQVSIGLLLFVLVLMNT